MITLDQNLFDSKKPQQIDLISKTKVLKTILGDELFTIHLRIKELALRMDPAVDLSQ